ncbi:MAG: hypothetical protein RJB66_1957 [Pseudomonadota bacterium]|jgi:ABC-type multidrug transport system ATPase subunit
MSFLINSIEFKDVSFAFEGEESVLQNANCSFPMGEIISLRGERGAGRSTLLQLLAGLQVPNQGRIEIDGLNVSEMSFDEFLPYRLKIGYAFDLGGLLSNRTISENLLLPLNYHKLCSPQEAAERVNYYINRFSLQKAADVRPANVSGGVRKLACLVRALLIEPELILLDDMTVGLSKGVIETYCQSIDDLRKAGKTHTVIFSSYDELFSSQFETVSLFLEGGQIYQHTIEKRAVSL